jgi:hypothetical protein
MGGREGGRGRVSLGVVSPLQLSQATERAHKHSDELAASFMQFGERERERERERRKERGGGRERRERRERETSEE